MRRLVYTPRAYVFVKDQDGDIHDLSRYVTEGSVTRRVDAVSSAEVTLRNPEMMFTAHRTDDGKIVGGKFHPMDPITIFLRRHRDHPVRVFTGFLDTADWLTLYPDTITLQASCTLKRLLHTYFDPALPYTMSFLQEYGWLMAGDGQWISMNGLNEFKNEDKDGKGGIDGSLSQLLFATLEHIGFWAPENIYIEALPDGIFERINELAQQFAADNEDARKQFVEMMRRIIGEGDFGTGNADVDVSGVDGEVAEIVYKVGRKLGVKADSKLMLSAFMTGIVESGMRNLSGGDRDSQGWRQERKSLYEDPTNVPHSAKRYFTEGQAIMSGKTPGKAGTGMYQESWTAGILAQSIQGSAYPGRYDDVRSSAISLLRRVRDTSDKEDPIAEPEGSKQFAQVSRSQTKGGSNKGSGESDKRHHPIGKKYGKSGAYGEDRGTHAHAGEDYPAPVGTPIYAAHSGTAKIYPNSSSGYGNYIDLKGSGVWTRYGHLSTFTVKDGEAVEAGEMIGRCGSTGHSSGPHLHFEVHENAFGSFGFEGTLDPSGWLSGAANPSGDADDGSASSGEDSNLATDAAAGGAAGAFFASLNLPSAMDSFAAAMLSGEKSVMNDSPLLPFVQQLCQSSLRHFQSLPDGKFYAFYPDYFGEMKQHPPYWEIDDIEVLDGRVKLSDDALVTHQYVVGDTVNPMGDTPLSLRSVFSSGVVTIFNAFMADSVLDRTKNREENEKKAEKVSEQTLNSEKSFKDVPYGLDILLDRNEAAGFLERYGVRPKVEDMPMIKSSYYEMLLAYQKFMQAWSRQFLTPFSFTFMPELFPGGKVGFKDHGLQMYIEEVTHTWSYESGFVTQATMSAPSVYGSYNSLLPPNMVRAMIEPAKPEQMAKQRAGGRKNNKSKGK